MKLVDILVLGTSAVKRIGSSPIEGKKSSKLYISFYVFFRGKKHRVEVFITGKRFEKSKSSLKKFSFIFFIKNSLSFFSLAKKAYKVGKANFSNKKNLKKKRFGLQVYRIHNS